MSPWIDEYGKHQKRLIKAWLSYCMAWLICAQVITWSNEPWLDIRLHAWSLLFWKKSWKSRRTHTRMLKLACIVTNVIKPIPAVSHCFTSCSQPLLSTRHNFFFISTISPSTIQPTLPPFLQFVLRSIENCFFFTFQAWFLCIMRTEILEVQTSFPHLTNTEN